MGCIEDFNNIWYRNLILFFYLQSESPSRESCVWPHGYSEERFVREAERQLVSRGRIRLFSTRYKKQETEVSGMSALLLLCSAELLYTEKHW